jgi:hypothetical protein
VKRSVLSAMMDQMRITLRRTVRAVGQTARDTNLEVLRAHKGRDFHKNLSITLHVRCATSRFTVSDRPMFKRR